ncbi:hypothetical protein Tsubulata_032436 [Turnera subulata]|uniref:Protein phosphatase n=1 Tax=Turnera subulata TaxID=218843 RepID=A0A9Q0JPI9_9ROSI|nr:hypothetical protein Tsubulata_032436 [Turnera subulata]
MYGSSTACIATLRREDNKLCYANVGDNGFLVFQNKRLLFCSPTQQHHFNCPYQLKKGGEARVCEGEVEVEGGDVVVAGSDGLLDNLFVEEKERILEDTVEGRRIVLHVHSMSWWDRFMVVGVDRGSWLIGAALVWQAASSSAGAAALRESQDGDSRSETIGPWWVTGRFPMRGGSICGCCARGCCTRWERMAATFAASSEARSPLAMATFVVAAPPSSGDNCCSGGSIYPWRRRRSEYDTGHDLMKKAKERRLRLKGMEAGFLL